MATRIFCEARSERAAADAGAENGAAAILKPVETRAVVAFASARGGVGKSAICVNVAAALAMTGRKVAIVDADLNSPGVLGMLRLKPLRRFAPGEEIDPASGPLGIRAVASSQLADGEPVAFSFFETDDAAPPAPSLNGARPLEVDYRATLRRLLAARFGPLDLMLIDLASGLSQLHCLAEVVELAGVVMVTRPSEGAVRATHDALKFIAHDGIAVLGLIENMSFFCCPSCGHRAEIFGHGGARAEAQRLGTEFLGEIPLQLDIRTAADAGAPITATEPDSHAAQAYTAIARRLRDKLQSGTHQAAPRIVIS